MSLITQIDKGDIKNIKTYIESISPLAVEEMCTYLKLQDIERSVFLMRYRDRKTIEEVSSLLNVSVPTVNRVILRLKRMLAYEVVRHTLN